MLLQNPVKLWKMREISILSSWIKPEQSESAIVKPQIFSPVNNTNKEELIRFSLLSSLADPTPEGKSIVELAKKAAAGFTSVKSHGWKVHKFYGRNKNERD